MERRLAAMGFTWKDTTATQVYTVHEIHPFFRRRNRAAWGGGERPDMALQSAAGD